ncbi:MAG: non-canonical purine NTP pyrophosphatase [Burkholderiales bacterium]|nr:non-canonical purine NTP pyrophosphatase [Burkholderiales bacterium]OJX08620.1 MAG: non-canonical purine NTP pyrophosphatase [Burkholderiales bacterium 70-64]
MKLERIVLASNNAGKLRELSALLAPLGLVLQAQAALGVTEAEEPFGTFLENALAKARHASRATGLPALADDSGLCVDALGGRPGVLSARWAAERARALGGVAPAYPAGDIDTANNVQLIVDLAGRSERAAHYYCVLVLLRSADDPQPLVADASWHGEVIDAPRGGGGFGYDPHFLLPELGCTAAQLDAQRKNALGHRGRALRTLVRRLRRERLVEAP